MGSKLKTLDVLTHECEIEQRNMPVVSVSRVLALLDTVSEQYAMPRNERRAFLSGVGRLNCLLNADTIDKWDAAGALYVLHQVLWAAEAAASAKKEGSVEPGYRPINQILEITRQLPMRIAELSKQERPAYFHRLHEACVMLPFEGHTGFANPVAYISDVAKALKTR